MVKTPYSEQCPTNVEEEAHCYVVQCRRIVCGQYVADYSTTECRTFWHNTADEGLRAETSCIQLLNNLLRIAHKLFAYIEQLVVVLLHDCLGIAHSCSDV